MKPNRFDLIFKQDFFLAGCQPLDVRRWYTWLKKWAPFGRQTGVPAVYIQKIYLMKRTILSLLFFFFSLGLQAQSVKLSGVVKDAGTRKGIENVTIQLHDADSVFVEGAVTDKAGKFELHSAKPGSIRLIVSCIGYEQSIVRLENGQQNTEIGEILLDETSESLGEIVVSGEKMIRKVNRQIIFPSGLQREASSTAFELLGKMMLPGLQVNTTQNTIASLNNGNVQLRIDNVKSSLQDVSALLPSQVIKVEYIDMPGARYGEGIAAVVNFVTRRASRGVSGGVNFMNAATTGYGNDNAYLKYNHKASQFVLNYALSYQHFDDKYTDTDQQLIWRDGSRRTLTKKGIESPYKWRQHDLSLAYNLTHAEKSVFNLKLSQSWQDNPYYPTVQSIRETGKKDLMAYTGVEDRMLTPVLDAYYQVNLPAGQTLMANVVGTYISSDYTRHYAEYLADASLLDNETGYTVDGDKYSLISELIYEKNFDDRLIWSTGVKYKQGYVENRYRGSTGDVTTSMDNSDLYMYTEVDGSVKKIGYNIGIGFSRQYFSENAHTYTYYTVRPTVSLSYAVTEKLFARYTFSINPILPDLSRLSDISQWQNDYEVMVGNPGLKPYRAYRNNLIVSYSGKTFFIQAMGYYQRNPKPIMMNAVQRIDAEDNSYFQYSYANQKSYDHLQGRLYLGFTPIANVLDVSVYGGINRYMYRGNEYTHTYTGYFGGAEVSAMYKKFSLSASVYSGIGQLMGETIRYSAAQADIALVYRLRKNLRFGVGITNPFFGKGPKSGEKLLSGIAPKETWNYTEDMGNMAYLSFSWNFAVGKKHNAGKTRLQNMDKESGVVK